MQEVRRNTVQEFATELKLLAQIARLGYAKAVLRGAPDLSPEGAVRAFWLENKGNLSKDPAEWRAFIDRRTYELQSLTETMSQHPELMMEGK